jgi:nucleoside-diphosphate-sugar epimerase
MIFGAGDTRHLKMFRLIARGRFFYVGRGDAWVHFIDIRDLVRAFELAMERVEQNGQTYLIAGRRTMKLYEACAIIAKEFGVRPPWIHLPVKPVQWLGSACEAICRPFGLEPPIFRRRVDFFTKSRFFDTSKAKAELGFEASQDFEAEVKDAVRWYLDHAWI